MTYSNGVSATGRDRKESEDPVHESSPPSPFVSGRLARYRRAFETTPLMIVNSHVEPKWWWNGACRTFLATEYRCILEASHVLLSTSMSDPLMVADNQPMEATYNSAVCSLHRSSGLLTVWIMEYAMKNGSATVLKKLKDAGHYPYSDLDREPVY